MNKALIFLVVILLSCSEKNMDQSTPIPIDTKPSDVKPIAKEHIGKDYIIDDQHSYIGFKIKYFGFSPVRGRFNSFDGSVFYDPISIENLRIELIIEINSINTGEEQRDKDLTSEDTWFDEPKFPKAYFSSKFVKPNPDGSFVLYGKLTIKGVTKEVQIPFDMPTLITRDWAKNEQVDFSGKLTINRQDFGIFGGDFWSSVMENGLTQLSDDVELEIDIHCRRPDYIARYSDMENNDIRKIVIDKISTVSLDEGLKLIDNEHKKGNITSGALSTIGYVLFNRSNLQEAKSIFNQKLELFVENEVVLNQLGISWLKTENKVEAKRLFEKANLLKENSRSRLYLASYFK